MADNKENQVPVTDAQVEQPPAPEEEQKKPEGEDAPPAAVGKEQNSKAVAAPKEKKPRPSKTAAHPPYFQMIKEALMALDEKSGSSPYAIAKKMEEKHKAVLPANFRKTLAVQLKNCESKGKLIKIKASYKLSSSESGKKKQEKKKSSSHPTPRTSLKARAAAAGVDHTKIAQKKKKKKKAKTKSVNDPETGRKKLVPKKSVGGSKAKQPRSIRSPAARAKRANAAA